MQLRQVNLYTCRTFINIKEGGTKSKGEHTNTLSTSNKNFIDFVRAIMPDSYDPKLRYKVKGYFDADSRTIFFDMEEAVEDAYRS